MYLLDSNVCIHLLNERHPEIERNFRSHHPSEIALCSIVKAELLFGQGIARGLVPIFDAWNSFFHHWQVYPLMTGVRKCMVKFVRILQYRGN